MSILNLARAVLGIDHSLMQLLIVSGICAAMAAQMPAQDGKSPADRLPQFVDALSHAYGQARNTLAKFAGIRASMTRRMQRDEE